MKLIVLRGLRAMPGVASWFHRFDLPFEVTVERHAARDKADPRRCLAG